MRAKIITILISLLLIAAISTVEQAFVKRIVRVSMDETQLILRDIREDRLNLANQKTHAMDQAWDKQAKLLEMLVDHGSTDDVRYALSRLIAALESGDNASAMIYAGELEGAIEHVYDRQAVTLENLL